MKKISVAIRTYNGSKYISLQLDSIIKQTRAVDEIVICDDNSTDNTVTILREYQKKYPEKIHVYTSTETIGSDENFEKAVQLCTGEIIFLSDQDDVWHNNKVAVFMHFFEQHPQALLVFNNGNIIDSHGAKTNTTLWEKWEFTNEMQRRWRNNNDALEDILKNGNKITGASTAFRKELIQQALPMHPSSGYWQDAWLGIFAAKMSGLAFIERPLFDYRVHKNQLVGILGKSPYPMNKKVICTIIAPNYIAQARALTKSFIEHEPNGKVYTLIVDNPGISHDFSKETFIAIQIQDINIPKLEDMKLRYNIRELCTAVKPFFLQYLLNTHNLDKLCYFDPDIYFYSNMDIVWESLETHDVVLTPHILQPLDEVFLPNEFSILQAGTYNLGFIGIRKSEQTKFFLTWWSQRLIQYSHGAPERHEHFDQRWIDLVPGFLDRVDINRNPGLNTAYWDVSNRKITKIDDKYYVNNVPLIFFHFSGYSPNKPSSISQHQNRFTFTEKPELKPLFDAYGKTLLEFGYTSIETTYKVPKRFGPIIYGKITRYLANKGWEEFLTTLLGQYIISIIRGLFLRMPRKNKRVVRLSNDQGVNIFGLFGEKNGVATVARNIGNALTTTRVPILLLDALHSTQLLERYRLSIINSNADTTQDVIDIHNLKKKDSEYIIGYWWWELDTFPSAWNASFSVVNEIWVGSEFVKKSLASVSPVPIYVMGTPVEMQLTPPLQKSQFGIPEESYVFLFVFDFQSYTERKNPYGLVEAYKRAFIDKKMRTTLVIKVLHANDFPNESKRLRDAVDSVSGIYIDNTMTREELSGLFLMADAYVSLHRSEGFGLTIAEAMYFEKPVIATNYSGNTDYMNNTNSYPIEYELIKIEMSVGPYKKGNVWADPNLNQAAYYMRYIVTHREEARVKAQRGAEDIKKLYSNIVIGKRMAKRIGDVYKQITYSK